MKSNKITMLLVVLVVLVAVFFILKFTGGNERSKSFRETLVELDTAKVTRIEIMSPEDTTELERKEGKWIVDGTKNGDDSSVKGLLSNLGQIEPSRLASRSEDAWKDFQVDEAAGTRVVVYEGDDKVLDIILGRFGVEGQRSFYSYVRLTDESDVYVANNFMKMSIGTGSEDYRNDDVLRIKRDSVEAITFSYPDSAFALSKGADGWVIDGTQPADSASVARYLNGLQYLSSRNFGEAGNEDSLYEVQLTTNSNSYTLQAFGENGLSSTYNAEEYWEDQSLREKVFKGKAEFITEE